MGLSVLLNGQVRAFEELDACASVAALVDALGLKADRVALEVDGEIVTRSAWGARL